MNCLNACFKVAWCPAARVFGCGQGGEDACARAPASPERSVKSYRSSRCAQFGLRQGARCLCIRLLVQRIWVQGFDKGFKGVSVKVSKSILNKNFNNSIFGGTIFAAADPFDLEPGTRVLAPIQFKQVAIFPVVKTEAAPVDTTSGMPA